MSRTDSRTTTRDAKLAHECGHADPNAERDRKGRGSLRWFRVIKKHGNRVRRYAGRKEISRQQRQGCGRVRISAHAATCGYPPTAAARSNVSGRR